MRRLMRKRVSASPSSVTFRRATCRRSSPSALNQTSMGNMKKQPREYPAGHFTEPVRRWTQMQFTPSPIEARDRISFSLQGRCKPITEPLRGRPRAVEE